MADRPEPRTFTVLGRQQVTPSMLRLTLGGPTMADFPVGQDGGYIKLRLEPEPGRTKPRIRTYTIRRQHADALDVDFALHGVDAGAAGPATDWAMAAQPGDTISAGGPGAAKPLPEGREFYVLAGDMAALPAISVNLETIDRAARGVAFIEVQQERDIQLIDSPEGVKICWLVNPEPGARPELLANSVRAYGWPGGDVYAWVACEFNAMRNLRDYLRIERGLDARSLYISSYWKSGLTEDLHKIAKREDAEALAGV